jgi:GT2 family glycosyltransferase
MPNAEPLFTVVIPTYNRPAQLARCLQSIQANGIGAEIVVVDDGSEPPAIGAGPCVTVLRQQHRGPAAARNRGAAQARGRYLAFTDDDCVVALNWLQALQDSLERSPEALIGGKVHNGEPDNWAAVFNQELQDVMRFVTEGTPRWFLPSNNLGVSAAAFQRSGGFDESFPHAAGEDRELCERWQRQGAKIVFEPAAVVRHHHRQGVREFWAMHKRYGAAARYLERRHPGPVENINRLRLYRLVSRRQSVARLALSQLAALAGYVEAWAR